MKRFVVLFITLIVVLTFTQNSYALREIDDCNSYLKIGEYEKAIKAGEISVRLYPKDFYANYCLGRAYYKIGEFDQALQRMKDAERLTTNKSDLRVIYSHLGAIYHTKGNLDIAFFYYSKHLSLSRELGNKRAEAKALNNIAEIYRVNPIFS